MLTIVLAFSLLDEEHVGRWLGRSKRRHASSESLGALLGEVGAPLCRARGGEGTGHCHRPALSGCDSKRRRSARPQLPPGSVA